MMMMMLVMFGRALRFQIITGGDAAHVLVRGEVWELFTAERSLHLSNGWGEMM